MFEGNPAMPPPRFQRDDLRREPHVRGVVTQFPLERRGDAELALAAGRGDGAAAGALWDRHAQLVRSVVRSSLGPDTTEDDLVQETFLGFFRGVAQLRDPTAVRSFLVSIAIRSCHVELRRRRLRRWIPLSPAEAPPDLIAEPLDASGRQAVRALYRILDTLSDRRRMAFTLRCIQGLELAEVATGLGVSESTAKREVQQARQLVLARAKHSEPALWAWLTANAGGHDDEAR